MHMCMWVYYVTCWQSASSASCIIHARPCPNHLGDLTLPFLAAALGCCRLARPLLLIHHFDVYCRAFFWGSILALWGTAGAVLSIKRGLGVERPEDVSPVRSDVCIVASVCLQPAPICNSCTTCWHIVAGLLS